MTHKISDSGIEHIKRWEGYRQYAYRDSAGLLTIGYGHLLTRSELSSGKMDAVNVRWRDGLTRAMADQVMRDDLRSAESCVRVNAMRPLTQSQFDALVSFTYNVGSRAFANSTLLRRIAADRYDDVPNQMRRWVYAGGKVIEGLKNRRESEVDLWLA